MCLEDPFKQPAAAIKNNTPLRLLDEPPALLLCAKVGIMLVLEMLKVKAAPPK
jgi:hypothetical protein